MIVFCYTYLAVNNHKVIEIMRNETDRYMDIMYIYSSHLIIASSSYIDIMYIYRSHLIIASSS